MSKQTEEVVIADRAYEMRTSQQRRFGVWECAIADAPYTCYLVFVRKAFGRAEPISGLTRWSLN